MGVPRSRAPAPVRVARPWAGRSWRGGAAAASLSRQMRAPGPEECRLLFGVFLWKCVSKIDFLQRRESGSGFFRALSIYSALTRLPIFLMV